MRVVIQRVKEASVHVGAALKASIEHGLLVFIGMEDADEKSDADWLIQKMNSLRIFTDKEGKMNWSIQDVKGSFLVVSQFTLFASTKKGNRPSFIQAARPEKAIPLYTYFIEELGAISKSKIETGEFGADMKVGLVNDGPVTLIIDSKNKV
jgi:D-aminoacyl-tRNA deacylase